MAHSTANGSGPASVRLSSYHRIELVDFPRRSQARPGDRDAVHSGPRRRRRYQRVAGLSIAWGLPEWSRRDKPGETYPLDAVERELLLEMLAALAKNSGEVDDR